MENSQKCNALQDFGLWKTVENFWENPQSTVENMWNMSAQILLDVFHGIEEGAPFFHKLFGLVDGAHDRGMVA